MSEHNTLPSYDLVQHLHRQHRFSINAFGPGPRTLAGIDHIKQELIEVEKEPYDIYEWVDIMLLAMGAAMRHGFTPEQVAYALEAKLTKNENRTWPDWRTADPNKAINHVEE